MTIKTRSAIPAAAGLLVLVAGLAVAAVSAGGRAGGVPGSPGGTANVWAAAGSAGAAPGRGADEPGQLDPSAIEAACHGFDPYYAVSRFVFAHGSREAPDAPVVQALRLTDPASPEVVTLATQGDVGAVYGLAYDHVRGTLYAAAYHKRSTYYGPGGTGQVYAIDLATGDVRRFATLFGGRNSHDLGREEDMPAVPDVGRLSLGDVDVDEDASTLFVMNMADGKVYRYSLPDGALLGSFDHGVKALDWARDARPMGLGFRDGWLYHGLVNSKEFGIQGELEAYVFRSRPDGSEMEEVVRFNYRDENTYPRPVPWFAWDSSAGDFPGGGTFTQTNVQPMLADIEFDTRGQLVVGLRDRVHDQIPRLDRNTNRLYGFPGVGDLVQVRHAGDVYAAITSPEIFEDQIVFDESDWGALAQVPGFDLVMTPIRGVIEVPGGLLPPDVGVARNWTTHGGLAGYSQLERFGSGNNPVNGLGDIEALCPRQDAPDPGALPTATAFVATATAGAKETATVRARTPTVIPTGTPDDFPEVIREACAGDNPYAVTVCYAPANLIQFNLDTDTLMIFSDTPANAPVFSAARASQVGAVWGLGYRATSGQLFAAAYQKRLVDYGPGGIGAIYTVDVLNGRVSHFADVDNPGNPAHGPVNGGDDQGRDAVGKRGLGDLDLSHDESQVFVMNLNERKIHRFDAVSGDFLGAFDHGAATEDWAADARPFGLGVREGLLYHGVVRSAQRTQEPAELTAHIYESAYDGSGMREVASFPLDYDRGTVTIPGVIQFPGPHEVPLDWLPWRDGDLDISQSRAQTAVYPQPLVADIEFGANGDMIVGMKDRFGDMALAFQRQAGGGRIDKPGIGLGDVLRLPFNGDTWDPPASYDMYKMPGDSLTERGHMGGLGQIESADLTLANRVQMAGDPLQGTFNPVEGVLWHHDDGTTARVESTCLTRIYSGGPLRPLGGPAAPQHSEWVPGKGMGDLEVMCGPGPPEHADELADADPQAGADLPAHRGERKLQRSAAPRRRGARP